MSDVFISYRREDFAIAKRVVDALDAQGLSVWWDESLTPRTSWDAELEREIAAAATVLVLWTPRSVESDWVRTEAHYGQDQGKLVPVMAERCTVPLAFLLRQTIDLCDWNGEADHRHWRKLLAWIADLAARRQSPAAPPDRGAAQPNAFRAAVAHLPCGDPVEDGAFVNASTPAGTAFRDGHTLPVMRIVPAGAFLLGSPAGERERSVTEGPQKRIEIPVPLAVGVFPVLRSEYEAEMGGAQAPATPAPGARVWSRFFQSPAAPASLAAPSDPRCPVTHVSFHDAEAFAAAISSRSGETYRLPSEAEWEYACRAGSRGRYAFGEAIDETMAAFGRRSGPVAPGAFRANAFGLYDMHGNVREWTADLWHESYDSTPNDGSPALEGHGSMRVVRGGGWSDSAALLRSAARMRATQTIRSDVIGFRVVRTLA